MARVLARSLSKKKIVTNEGKVIGTLKTAFLEGRLTEEELADHEKGKFLPEICDHVPEGLMVLRPGHSYKFE